ncbi:MAG: histidinol phosphate phosphatase domain-containing protein [Deltaproteobacteria bacterium]|nr:histidinol phosphate phosphatase domain-containing protein [Deltaproteobacteria bacterium]
MIDCHTHSIHSDGVLIPSELIRRAAVAGYTSMAITDHADESNIDALVESLAKVCALYRRGPIIAVAGVELTHIPPGRIPALVKRARALGAKVVIGHGETLAEPVEPGTNAAYIKAGADILAHPGLVTDAECVLARKKSVFFEITARGGHSISNGHVAAAALRHGVGMVINTDAHAPGDLISDARALQVVLGAGLKEEDFRRMQLNAKALLGKPAR